MSFTLRNNFLTAVPDTSIKSACWKSLRVEMFRIFPLSSDMFVDLLFCVDLLALKKRSGIADTDRLDCHTVCS